MKIGEIVRRSFILAWELKSLWIFAFFLTPNLIGIRLYNPQYDPAGDFPWEQILRFMMIGGIAAAFYMFVTPMIQATLIIIVFQRERGTRMTLKDGISRSLDYYWRCFLLSLYWLFIALLIGIAATLILVPAFLVHLAVGLLVSFVMVPVLLLLLLAYLAVTAYSYRFVVIENQSVRTAIKTTYSFFKERKAQSLIASVANFAIAFGISMVTGIVVVMVQFLLALPAVVAGESLLSVGSNLPSVAFSVVVSLVVMGFCSLFNSAFWTIFIVGSYSWPAVTVADTPPLPSFEV